MGDNSEASGAFTFGIYPGGAAGGPDGMVIGPPDDAEQIAHALDRIQGTVARFYVRGYLPFQDVANASVTGVRETPSRLAQYLGRGRLLDLVLQFQSKLCDVDGWLQFVGRAVRTSAPYAGNREPASVGRCPST